jgi:hypothetical protein
MNYRVLQGHLYTIRVTIARKVLPRIILYTLLVWFTASCVLVKT